MNLKLDILDVGGGLGIPYAKDHENISLEAGIRDLLEIAKMNGIPEVWMELGRYAVGPHGYYVSAVVDRKTVRGTHILVLDGGNNHTARPSLTGEAFPAEMLRVSTASPKNFKICGPLCTALDQLGIHDLPEDIKAGDHIVFHQAGAYGFTESMSYFLCHPQAAEVVMSANNYRIVRPSLRAEEWLV